MELMTKRLILRPFTLKDVDAVHAYASDIDNVRYMIWGPNGEKDTEAFIEDCLCKADETPRLHYDFAVTLKESGKLIGGCGIYLNKEQPEGMLGWILHRDYWKQGYTPEAAIALLHFGFETLELHRIYATCNADNYGSWRVMEKCGMRREAYFIKNRFGRVGAEQVWYDEYHYAMLDEEWKATRADIRWIDDDDEKARIARDVLEALPEWLGIPLSDLESACDAILKGDMRPCNRPEIVCLCGSTRFYNAFQRANYELTMQGKIVLSVGFYPHSQEQAREQTIGCTTDQKAALDELHKRKIDLADKIFVLNVGGYIGESTHSEIEYALAHEKPVDYLEAAEAAMKEGE